MSSPHAPAPRDTRIITVDPAAPDPAAIAHAAAALRTGGLVAFPTETVYGLGADALDAAAVRGIFAAKGRPAYNPLIVHVPDVAAARQLVMVWPEAAARAAEAFWPGPLTLVLPKRPVVPAEVTAGLDTVGVRVPSHPVALALLRAAHTPVAAPSANLFTRLSATTAAHVIAALRGRVDVVIDGGATPLGIESTVLDLSGERPVVLRPGVIGIDELEPVIGPVLSARGADRVEREADVGTARRSPGMMERHYSPAARLVLFADPDDGARVAADARAAGRRVGALVRHSFAGPADEVLVLPNDAPGYARLLYASLHALDSAGCDIVVVEAPPPDDAMWHAVQDRLARAAR